MSEFPSPALVRYVDITFRLHVLMRAGQGDTDAADAIREEAESAHWDCNAFECRFVDCLSGDLFQLEGSEVDHPQPVELLLTQPPCVDPRDPEGTTLFGIPEFALWCPFLNLAARLPDVERAALRALAYGALGFPQVATAFREYAIAKAAV